jgi:hypothetical protein
VLRWCADGLEDHLGPLVEKPRQQLLGVPEDDRPGEDLGREVEGAEPGDELTAHQEQAQQRGQRSCRELQHRQRNREAVRRRASLHLSKGDRCGECRGGGPDDQDGGHVPGCGRVVRELIEVVRLALVRSLVERTHDLPAAAGLDRVEAHVDVFIEDGAQEPEDHDEHCHQKT